MIKALLFGALLGIVIVITCAHAEESEGFIAGKVSPHHPSLKVVLIHNLSIVAETAPDTANMYRFENLKNTSYSLLFLTQGLVYVYNDAINNDLLQRVRDGEDRVAVNLKETVTPSRSDVDMDLTKEHVDYIDSRVTVKFNAGASDDKIENIIASCECKVVNINKQPYGNFYTLETPASRTVLEVIRDLNAYPEVNFAEWDTIVSTATSNHPSSLGNRTETVPEVENTRSNVYLFLVVIMLAVLLIVWKLKRKK